jgi:hypothetical protein
LLEGFRLLEQIDYLGRLVRKCHGRQNILGSFSVSELRFLDILFEPMGEGVMVLEALAELTAARISYSAARVGANSALA